MVLEGKVPLCEFALIGGSSTHSIDIFKEVSEPSLRVIEKRLVFDTPFGKSPSFVLFELGGKKGLFCKMHGWRRGTSRTDASRQLFWVLKEACVERIISEGGVGSLNPNLKPRDIIVPQDYIDFSQRRDVTLTGEYLLIMREPLCPTIRTVLIDEAKKLFKQRKIKEDGVYVVTDGYHFESRAEIGFFSTLKADVVGQSLSPEVYLSREIGACYAGVYMIVNMAEGIGGDWSYEELRDIFYSEAKGVAKLVVSSLKRIVSLPFTCNCKDLRKLTLIK